MKEVKYFRGKYYQGSLSDNNAEAIYNILKNHDVVSDLKYEITNLPYHLTQKVVDKYQMEEEMSGFVKEGQFNLFDRNDYIGVLRDEQTIGVAFLYLNGSCLLGDEVGLGKTVEVAGFANVVRKQFSRQNKHFSFLFLTEKTSVEQIRSKLIQFTGEYVGLLPSGEQAVLENFARVRDNGSNYSVVATHAALDSNVFLESLTKHPFDVLVIDEGVILKNKGTNRYYNTLAFTRIFKHRIVLNATPLEITSADLYNQLEIVDETLLPSKKEFEATYCVKKRVNMYNTEIVGYKNEDIFREAISLRYLARTRGDLGGVYEDNEYKIVVSPLSKKQKEMLKKTSLRQMCVDYPTGVNRRIPYNEETCGKVKSLLEVLEDCDPKNNKSLVYVRFKECQAELKTILETKGYSVAIINGGVTNKLRTKIIDDANVGVYDIILTNIYRAYDLPDFVNCIFYTVDPNPQKMVQFEGRITRDVDVVGKRVYLIFAEGQEMATLKTLKDRVSAAQKLTTTGRSLVSEAIMRQDNIERETTEPDTDLDRLRSLLTGGDK